MFNVFLYMNFYSLFVSYNLLSVITIFKTCGNHNSANDLANNHQRFLSIKTFGMLTLHNVVSKSYVLNFQNACKVIKNIANSIATST